MIRIWLLLRETVHEHTHNSNNYSFYFSDMPIDNYMTIAVTVFFEAFFFFVQKRLQLQLQFFIHQELELIVFWTRSFSVNQLSVHGAVADLCKEWTRDSRGAWKPAANDNLEYMVIPTEFLTANPIFQTEAEVQRNLLRKHEQKFAELLEQQKLAKLCSNAGFSKSIDKGTVLHYTWWWWCTWRYERIMSRVYLTPEWGIIPRERVHPWKREDRPSPGCESLL